MVGKNGVELQQIKHCKTWGEQYIIDWLSFQIPPVKNNIKFYNIQTFDMYGEKTGKNPFYMY